MIRKLAKTTRESKVSLGLLVLRLGTAFSMITLHGHPKLVHWPESADGFFDPIGAGPTTSFVMVLFAEYFCSLLIAVGGLTRLAAIPPIIAMATATFIYHSEDPFPTKEKSYLYLVIFVVLLITGAGKYSIDGTLRRGKK